MRNEVCLVIQSIWSTCAYLHVGYQAVFGMLLKCLAVALLVLVDTLEVASHGRLIEPPSRSSMWRYGFNTPPNYNDIELFCGGFTRQYQMNHGRCGVCGDPYDAPQPRPNEGGGIYGQGIIVRNYKVGSKIVIKVELTANHHGYFEFRICPNNNPKVVATQECLDKYILQRSRPDASGHHYRTYPGPGNGVIEMRYNLPPDLTCTQCVLQWRYIAGNNWGHCPNGTDAVGCGPQEEFRACADVSISDGSGYAEDTPYTPATKPTDTKDADKKDNEFIFVISSPGFAQRLLPYLIGCLFACVVVLAGLYVYFYHLSDVVKKSLLRGKEQIHPPTEVKCVRPETEEPVAPPRTRRPNPPTQNNEQYFDEKKHNNNDFIY